MSTDKNLEQQLSRLGAQLAAPPSIAVDVMRRIETAASPKPHARRRRYVMQAILGLAAGLLAATSVWFAFFSNPATLYAQVMAALEDTRSLRITGEHYRDGAWRKAYEAWYEEGVGAAQLVWKDGQLQPVNIDDGRHSYQFRSGAGKPTRGRSSGPRSLIAKMLYIRERHPGWQRAGGGDMAAGKGTARMYEQFTPDGRSRYRIWIDGDNRVVRFEEHNRSGDHWQPDERAVVQYDVPVDRALWAKYVPAGGDPEPVAGDARSLLEKRFGLDTALATKEVLGLVFAVHELTALEDGRLLLAVSLRPSAPTIQRLGPYVEKPGDTGDFQSWGRFQLIPYFRRLPDGDYVSDFLVFAPIAEFSTRGIHGYWYIVQPQGDWASEQGELRISGYVHTQEKLQQTLQAASQQWYDQFHPLVTVPLPKDPPAASLADAIRRTYDEVTTLDAAGTFARLWSAAQPRSADTYSVRNHSPQEMSLDDFAEECRTELARRLASHLQWERENKAVVEKMRQRRAPRAAPSRPGATQPAP